MMDMKLRGCFSWFVLGIFFFMTSCVVVEGEVHYHDFVVKDKNFTRVCHTKSMLVVNGQFPGPTLYVRNGDTMFVNVHNQGDYGFTIHWHGVNQPRNPWSDGPEFITQCAIEPGSNFTYEVIFSEEEGTLWWHAHSNWTRNTVHGAIVILPTEGSTYPFPTPDVEQILILGSWYNYDVNLVLKEDLVSGGELPISTAYLTNGQPGDLSPCSSNDSTFRLSVDYGKTYLLRVINTAMNAELFFKIAEHNLTIVGTDAAYIKPLVSSYIMIAPGQSMDILVTANKSSLGQYYMVARQLYSGDTTFPDYNNVSTTSILEYNGGDTSPPIFPENLPAYTDILAGFSFMEQFRSLASEEYPVDVPRNITTSMYITAAMGYQLPANLSVEASLTSSLNNISWVNPTTDVLQAYYRDLSGFFSEDFPDEPPSFFNFTSDELGVETVQPIRATKVKMLNYNEEVEIVYQSSNVMNASEDHPMHLHGHSFYVVGSGAGLFDPEIAPLGYNFVDPPYVSTTSVPKNGWLTLRFRANNPGVWLFHCHFDRHFSWGMEFVFIVRNGGTPETSMRHPPAGMPSCKASSAFLFREANSFVMET